jgi:hypothetical protein
MRTTAPTPGHRTNPLRPWLWCGAAALLLLPAVAMQFSSEVDWSATDFVLMGVLLGGVCLAYEIVTRLSSDRMYRLGAGVGIAGAFLLIWADLAVGYAGDGRNVINEAVFAVPAVAWLVALYARFTARGMARAMVVAAGLQAGLALAAPLLGFGSVLLQSLFFIVIWLTAAQCFRIADAPPSSRVRPGSP